MTAPAIATGSLPPPRPSSTLLLSKHHATMKCQFDAFGDYVAEAEKNGIENYPLYEWTKATIEDPAKKAKHLKSFTLFVDGNEVYAKDNARRPRFAWSMAVAGSCLRAR